MAQAIRRAGLLFAAGGIGQGRPLAAGDGSRGKDNGTVGRHKFSGGQRGFDTEKEKKGKTEIQEKQEVGRTYTEGRAFPLGPVWTPMEVLNSHGHIHRTLCLFPGKFQKWKVLGQDRLGERYMTKSHTP